MAITATVIASKVTHGPLDTESGLITRRTA